MAYSYFFVFLLLVAVSRSMRLNGLSDYEISDTKSESNGKAFTGAKPLFYVQKLISDDADELTKGIKHERMRRSAMWDPEYIWIQYPNGSKVLKSTSTNQIIDPGKAKKFGKRAAAPQGTAGQPAQAAMTTPPPAAPSQAATANTTAAAAAQATTPKPAAAPGQAAGSNITARAAQATLPKSTAAPGQASASSTSAPALRSSSDIDNGPLDPVDFIRKLKEKIINALDKLLRYFAKTVPKPPY